MDYKAEQFEALEALGAELETVGWEPETVAAQGFDDKKDEPQKRRWLGAQFLYENDRMIREKVCSGGNVKIEIQTAGASIAAIADALQSAVLPIPAWSLANALCNLGLTKYCSRPVKP